MKTPPASNNNGSGRDDPVHRALDVLGLPVMSLANGEEVGRVRDLLFDSNHSLKGVMMESRGLLHRKHFIPADQIHALGDDCLTIKDASALTSLHDQDQRGCYTMGSLKGKHVITRNGQELGQVKDVYFREELGSIVGYELSDGFLSDVMEGRKILKRPEQITYGKDALIVPVSMQHDVTESM